MRTKVAQDKQSVLIVGGGIAGLATAALLGKQGFKVTLIEKNNQFGGRASVLKTKGFTFDMGPSWYMMPEIFERYFALFGKKPTDFYALKRLDPQYKIYWDDKTTAEVHRDLKKTLSEFETIEPGSGKKLKQYLKIAAILHNVAVEKFFYTDFPSFRDKLAIFIHKSFPKKYFFMSVDRLIKEFAPNDKIRQALTYWAVFLGASPYQLPALYSMMSHVDLINGVYYPDGGINKIVSALVTLCKEHNVTLQKEEPVIKFIIKDDKITGLKTEKKTYYSDIVISNADYAFTETQLLPKASQSFSESYWKKKTYSPSMFLLYLGIKGRLKNARHHTFFFADNWEKHFDTIFKDKKWPDNPSFYFCVPSKTDQSVAPIDHENIFVLAPIAPGLKDDEKTRNAFKEQLLKKAENQLGESIRERIVFEKIYSVSDFEKDYNAYAGNAFGLAHTLSQTAFLRPPMQSRKVKNLYFVGQYTLPGTGMPIGLVSAEILAQKIKEKYA